MSNLKTKGLCFRCEHRARFLEEGTAPRAECSWIEDNKSICYNYKPVMPCTLEYPDYGDTEYNQMNKQRSPFGGLLGAKMQFKDLANCTLELSENEDTYTLYYKIKERKL